MAVIRLRRPTDDNATDNIVALRCALNSGEQWTTLFEACHGRYNTVAPDISGYSKDVPRIRDQLADLAAHRCCAVERRIVVEGIGRSVMC